jgi:hypothetical protein
MTSLAAFLVPAAIVGVTWFVSRAGADQRRRAALDRYAEREEVKPPKSPAGRSRKQSAARQAPCEPIH